MGLREEALGAYAETPAERERREAEESRRREQERLAKTRAELSVIFLARARAVVKVVLGADVYHWEVVESSPDLAVLRDPSDDSYHKLTLAVRSGETGELVVTYAPWESWGWKGRLGVGQQLRTSGVCPEREYWMHGPVVTDLASLGAEIARFEQYNRDVNASMPDYLP